jgi:hypothetical protein
LSWEVLGSIPPSRQKINTLTRLQLYQWVTFWCSRIDPASNWEVFCTFSLAYWETYYRVGILRHRLQESNVTVVSFLRNKKGDETLYSILLGTDSRIDGSNNQLQLFDILPSDGSKCGTNACYFQNYILVWEIIANTKYF